MTGRFIQRNLFNALKIVWGFVFKQAAYDPSIARDLFFDASVTTAAIEGYCLHFQEDSRVGIDLASLAAVLPSRMSDKSGVANWISHGSAEDKELAARSLVLGAELDFIVDHEGVRETAQYLGLEESFLIPGAPHDFFLSPEVWKDAALPLISAWLDRFALKSLLLVN